LLEPLAAQIGGLALQLGDFAPRPLERCAGLCRVGVTSKRECFAIFAHFSRANFRE
jgi:hypothetical protein